MKLKFHWMTLALATGWAWAVLPDLAVAQGISLAVGNSIPVTNALGFNLTGTWGDPGNSCRVEIRQAWTGGLILAPTNDPGQIEAYNPLITNSYLGHGVVGSNPGLYSETFTNRSVLATNLMYYARVFDRPDPAAAIYYADTPPFYGPPATDGSINPEFGTLKLASGEEDVDTDGDGIPDAMESDMGLDSGSGDTDGDGYGDWFEATHGQYLLPTEPDPALAIQINAPANAVVDPHTVSWWTIPVPGMTYRLDYRPQWADENSYSNIWSGTATDTNLEVDVEDWVQTEGVKGFFRVTVPYEGP